MGLYMHHHVVMTQVGTYIMVLDMTLTIMTYRVMIKRVEEVDSVSVSFYL